MIIIGVYSLILTRVKYEFLLYVFSFSLMLTPSTKLLGLYSENFLNININQLIIYSLVIIFPISVVLKFPPIMYAYYKKIGKSLVFIIIAFLLNAIINSIFYGIHPLSLPKYHLVEFISFFVILHFALILFNKIKYNGALVVVKNIWVTLVVFSALLGFLFMLEINFVIKLQELAYNFNYSNTNARLETGIDASYYLNRSYSVFSGSNQYSTIAPVSLVIFYFLLKQNIMSKKLFVILIGFQVLILISALSRTGFLLYILTIIIILAQNSKYIFNYILYSLILFVALYFTLSFFDNRIQEIFNFELVFLAFLSERLFHWIIFFDILNNSPESIFLGVYEYYLNTKNNFFENGYLNIWAEGGLLSLLSYIAFYFSSLKWFSKYKTVPTTFKRLVVNYFLLFIIFEILMGVFVGFRFESINAITIAFFIYFAFNNIKQKVVLND